MVFGDNKKWNNNARSESVRDKLREVAQSQTPLKPRIELAQIRRTNKMVNSAKLAFEQIQLRLNTMTELGDIVVTLSPAMSVIKGIQGGLKTMLPEADQSFGQISDLLGGIMSGSSQMATTEVGTKELTFDEEAIKIIEEASAIVEEDTRDKFPDLPMSSTAERMPSSNNNGGRKETSMY